MQPVLIKTKHFDTEQFSLDVLRFRIEKNLTRIKLWRLIRAGSSDCIIRIENGNHKPPIEVAINLCELMDKNIYDYVI